MLCASLFTTENFLQWKTFPQCEFYMFKNWANKRSFLTSDLICHQEHHVWYICNHFQHEKSQWWQHCPFHRYSIVMKVHKVISSYNYVQLSKWFQINLFFSRFFIKKIAQFIVANTITQIVEYHGILSCSFFHKYSKILYWKYN